MRLVDAFVFFCQVPLPVGVEVAVGSDCSEFQDRFGAVN
jgi:hypothetical protein